MPTRKTRKNGPAKGPNPQINQQTSKAGQQGNGVQSFDGRANTNAGSTVSPVPKSLPLDPRIVRTYGS